MKSSRKNLRLALLLIVTLVNLLWIIGPMNMTEPRICDSDTVGFNWICLKEQLQDRWKQNEIIIAVQVNEHFIPLALNLVCSADKVGIPKEAFLIWAMDEHTDIKFKELGFLSYYNPYLFYGVREGQSYHSTDYNRMMRGRALFWKLLHYTNVPFWWVDADIVLHSPIAPLLEGHEQSDVIFQLDSFSPASPENVHNNFVSKEGDDFFVGACGGLFHVKPTSGAGIFLEAVESALLQDNQIEDQQAMDIVLKSDLVHYAGNNSDKIPSEKVIFSFLDQENAPVGHFAFRNDQRFDQRASGKIVLTHWNGLPPQQKDESLRNEGQWLLDENNKCL